MEFEQHSSLTAAIEAKFSVAYNSSLEGNPSVGKSEPALFSAFTYEIIMIDPPMSLNGEISNRYIVYKGNLDTPGLELQLGEKNIDIAYQVLQVPKMPGDQRTFSQLTPAILENSGYYLLVDKMDRAWEVVDGFRQIDAEPIATEINSGVLIEKQPSWIA